MVRRQGSNVVEIVRGRGSFQRLPISTDEEGVGASGGICDAPDSVPQ